MLTFWVAKLNATLAQLCKNRLQSTFFWKALWVLNVALFNGLSFMYLLLTVKIQVGNIEISSHDWERIWHIRDLILVILIHLSWSSLLHLMNNSVRGVNVKSRIQYLHRQLPNGSLSVSGITRTSRKFIYVRWYYERKISEEPESDKIFTLPDTKKCNRKKKDFYACGYWQHSFWE